MKPPARICGAKTRAGGTCKQAARANGRCRFHGGMTPRGIASPHWKTGRYSKYLPERLQERYQASVKDPELLALREDIALLDARLADVLGKVDSGESTALWRTLQQTFDAFKLHNANHDIGKIALTLTELETLITRGMADYAAWDDIRLIIEQRRKLVESESKRLTMGQMVLKLDEANTLVAALSEAVRLHVTDRPTLSRISDEFIRIIGVANRTETEPAA